MGTYRMDGENVDVELKDGRLRVGESSIRPWAATLERRRVKPMSSILIALSIIALLGLSVTFLLTELLVDSERSEPFKDLNEETAINWRVLDLDREVSILASDGTGGNLRDLSGDVEYDRIERTDVLDLYLDIEGDVFINFMWYGDMLELDMRHISRLKLEFLAEVEYNLESVSMVTLDEEGLIERSKNIELESRDRSTRTGKGEFLLDLREVEVSEIISMQSGYDVDRVSTHIRIRLAGPLEDEGLLFNFQWGPDHYRETNSEFVMFSLIMGGITVFTMALFYFSLSKKETVLVVDHEGGEITLMGEDKDLSGLHYELAKMIIRSLPRDKKEEKGPDTGRFGSKEVFGKEDAERIQREQKGRVMGRKRIVIQECPDCGGNELYYEGGLISGSVYHCKKCDYVGSFVIEREVDLGG